MNAIENLISDKKYLFGDQPIVEDAVVFAWMCQVFYNDKGPLNNHLTSQLGLKICLKKIIDIYF